MRYEDLVQLFRDKGQPPRYGLESLSPSVREPLWVPEMRPWDDLWDLEHEIVAIRHAVVAHQDGAVWAAIAFLDGDPYFFPSGYEKQRMLGALRRVDLDSDQVQTLLTIGLRHVDRGPRGVGYFDEFARLTARLASEAFKAELRIRLSSDNPRVASRASFMLNKIALAQKGKGPASQRQAHRV